MSYGVIFKHLEVDKITWGSFSKKKEEKRGALMAFLAGKRGGCPFLTGVEDTETKF
jgi:hypothetical protein